jgi:hypothetical protein
MVTEKARIVGAEEMEDVKWMMEFTPSSVPFSLCPLWLKRWKMDDGNASAKISVISFTVSRFLWAILWYNLVLWINYTIT